MSCGFVIRKSAAFASAYLKQRTLVVQHKSSFNNFRPSSNVSPYNHFNCKSLRPDRRSLFTVTTSHSLYGHSNTENNFLFQSQSSLDPTTTLYGLHKLQQVRWKGRNDGNRFHGRGRPPTKKARKAYRKAIQKMQEKENRHSNPGSKARVRKEWNKHTKELMFERLDDLDKRRLAASGSRDVALLENESSPDNEYELSDAILDDLMGNSPELSSTPTPEPLYLGHKYQYYYNRVVNKMEKYRNAVKVLTENNEGQNSTDGSPLLIASNVSLPSDYDISVALHSFRDRKGTRSKPIGIVAALKHVLQDMGVPVSAFGEKTYTTLLTCCRDDKEARRVFQLMREQQVQITEYSWSILVDIHAKVGDYKGCIAVHEEMLKEGIAPTLASYTSLLAACYKVCINGRIPPNVRSEAAKAGWEKWKEMRIVGLEPDVMAYGAILRLTSASGQPEKALNFLNEMREMEVKPTTLCFTSALRAIARSQSTAARYENGVSRRNLRREFLTQHHGKMAQAVLIMAENAEVEQDDGFIAALIMCAAEAGDVSTAKAIYVASQIRKLDQFRTLGPDSYLAQLRGESPTITASGTFGELSSGASKSSPDGSDEMTISEYQDHNAISNKQKKHKTRIPYGEREYGKDNRVLSAILHACARAVDKSGIGTMWQGRENEGYLCVNSLRLINARRIPRYVDQSIPGQTITDNLTWDGETKDKESYRPGKRVPRKFQGVYPDDSASTLEDLSPEFQSIYVDEYGRRKEQFRQASPKDIWKLKYGKHSGVNYEPDVSDDSTSTYDDKLLSSQSSLPMKKTVQDLSFDQDSMSWKTPLRNATTNLSPLSLNSRNDFHLDSNETGDESTRKTNQEGEMYFDMDTMRWTTRIIKDSTDTSMLNSKSEKVDTFISRNDKNDLHSSDGVSTLVSSDFAHINTSDDFLHSQRSINDSIEMLNDEKYRIHVKGGNDDILPSSLVSSEKQSESDKVMYFDDSEMRWKTRTNFEDNKTKLTSYEADLLSKKSSDPTAQSNQDDVTKTKRYEAELLINNSGEAMPQTTNDNAEKLTSNEAELPFNNSTYPTMQSTSTEDDTAFVTFLTELQDELALSGDEVVSEEEARELFQLMKDEYNEVMTTDLGQLGLDELGKNVLVNAKGIQDMNVKHDIKETNSTIHQSDTDGKNFESALKEINSTLDDQGFKWDGNKGEFVSDTHYDLLNKETAALASSHYNNNSHEVSLRSSLSPETIQQESERSSMDAANFDEMEEFEDEPLNMTVEDWELEELREYLPVFSDKRLRKILKVFKKSLGTPKLLDLTLVVRERMPDYVTLNWLQQMSYLTAKYVVKTASNEGQLDTYILNNVLELQTVAGGVQGALECYHEQFERHNLEPTEYSDRLVLQMFLRNNRLQRALAFKQRVQDKGKNIDIKAYGSLVDYCCRQNHLGSALLLIRECIRVHNSPPEEASLQRFRQLCRLAKLDMTEIIKVIGPDPLDWLRHGEAKLKREMSKKGRRDVLMARNQAVRI